MMANLSTLEKIAIAVLATCVSALSASAQEGSEHEGRRISESMEASFSGSLVEEVLSQSADGNIFHWRRSRYELESGLGFVQENNNYESYFLQLGVAIPTSGGLSYRLGLRRIECFATENSDNMGRTPFVQKAQSNRYEIYGGVGWSLLEGKVVTRLSPFISDLDHVLQILAHIHYGHRSTSRVPRLDSQHDPMPGQKPVHGVLVSEWGARWSLYLPQGVGVFWDAAIHIPLKNEGGYLRTSLFQMGVLWSVQ